jgi:hypothetical protein
MATQDPNLPRVNLEEGEADFALLPDDPNTQVLGNGLNNRIYGNAADNTIEGVGGDDSPRRFRLATTRSLAV